MFGRLLREIARVAGVGRVGAGARHADAALRALRQGNTGSAEELGRRATRQAPESSRAAFILGLVLRAQGRAGEALEQLEQAARLSPREYDVLLTTGLTLCDLGRRREAVNWFDQALSVGRDAVVLNERGICLLESKRVAQAETDFRAAIALDPAHAGAHCNLGIACAIRGASDEALSHLRRASSLDPDSLSIRCSLATALRDADQHEQALAELDGLQHANAGHVDSSLLKGLLLRELGRPQDAVDVLLRLPESVGTLCNLGLARQDLGDFSAAEDAYARALVLEPGCQQAVFNRGMLNLLRGRWNSGWRDYAARFGTPETPRRDFGSADWDGASVAGRLVVYAEQGLGDEIMFAGCMPDLSAQVDSLVLECDPRLGRLFARSFPDVTVIAQTRERGPASIREKYEPVAQVAAGELPERFRTSDAAFEAAAGSYLKADPERVLAWRNRLSHSGEGICIGVAWRGGVHRTRRAARSVDPDDLLSRIAGPGRMLVSLQHDAVPDELKRLERAFGLQHWPDVAGDIDDLAALLCALDVVVTVCQTLVHIAGALGRPAMVLTPFVPEWRYGLDGERMPWYRSVTLLRQSRPGDWSGPCTVLGERLKQYLDDGN